GSCAESSLYDEPNNAIGNAGARMDSRGIGDCRRHCVCAVVMASPIANFAPTSLAFALILAFVCPLAAAKGGGSHGSYSTGTHGHHAATGVERDSHGHIKRSEQAKDAFKKSHPCPATGK